VLVFAPRCTLLLQVQGIMVTLTMNQFLAPEHLDMLWAVTEKVRQQQRQHLHLAPTRANIWLTVHALALWHCMFLLQDTCGAVEGHSLVAKTALNVCRLSEHANHQTTLCSCHALAGGDMRSSQHSFLNCSLQPPVFFPPNQQAMLPLTATNLRLLCLCLQEDTYEAVKTHMFDLLAEIASRFLPNQLDMLFAKLENAQQRSTQDTQRLLGLLQHLAASDKEVNMCEKIVDMVWALTMSDTVHPDVVSLGALAGVVKAYKLHLQVTASCTATVF
jgi:hypothetical protein